MNVTRILAVLIASALVALGLTVQVTDRITDSSGAIMSGVTLMHLIPAGEDTE